MHRLAVIARWLMALTAVMGVWAIAYELHASRSHADHCDRVRAAVLQAYSYPLDSDAPVNDLPKALRDEVGSDRAKSKAAYQSAPTDATRSAEENNFVAYGPQVMPKLVGALGCSAS